MAQENEEELRRKMPTADLRHSQPQVCRLRKKPSPPINPAMTSLSIAHKAQEERRLNQFPKIQG